MTKLFGNAWKWFFKGLRTRSPGLTGIGAALAALAWIRKSSRGREVLWSKTLRPGDTFRVRLLRADDEVEAEVDVEG